ncbi:uncharacterized protein LOC6647430 [Drosophila willistoni]|uniref:uncharacterized protein LOC6647430 n=1 Tax=Drosophila willistoni TaxID=7260 RepID=UPI00017D8655|nr:uncharacterized protein LOC6647430 [Drosophila willistoni]
MDLYKLSFLLVILCVGLVQSQRNSTLVRDCSNRCTWRARCSPYYKSLVWTIVNGVCRVYQNGCIFGSENCMRVNQCLEPMVAVDRCSSQCAAVTCPTTGPQVCGWFPYVDANGNNKERQLTFTNRCLLNVYSCLSGEAYVGEPTQGPCQ